MAKAALTVYKALGLAAYSRADFIYDDEGNFWFIEINTLPGHDAHEPRAAGGRRARVRLPELARGNRFLHGEIRMIGMTVAKVAEHTGGTLCGGGGERPVTGRGAG